MGYSIYDNLGEWRTIQLSTIYSGQLGIFIIPRGFIVVPCVILEIRLNLDFELIFNLLKKVKILAKRPKKLLKSYLNLYKVETSLSCTSSGSELRDDSLKANITDNSTASSRFCSCQSVSILQ